jgi:hypothetical protein
MAFVFDFLGAKEYLSVWHSGRLVSTGLSSNTLTKNTYLIVPDRDQSTARSRMRHNGVRQKAA